VEWLGSVDIPTYINMVDVALSKEDARAVSYLHAASTGMVILRIVLEECLIKHSNRIFEAVQDVFYAVHDNSKVKFSNFMQP
jgi:D-ribose pyranose/furanose isomerase RbsD